MRNSDNVRSSDSFERLIHEGNLKIRDVRFRKDEGSMEVILTSGSMLTTPLSISSVLVSASEKALKNWSLIGSGVGIHWTELDEDLSLKGLISEVVLRQLGVSGNDLKVAV